MLLSMGAGAAGKGLQMIPAVSRFAKAAPSVAKLLNFATKPAAVLEVARTIQGVHQDGIQHLMHNPKLPVSTALSRFAGMSSSAKLGSSPRTGCSVILNSLAFSA